MPKPRLFLIPSYLSGDNTPAIIAPIVKEVIENTHYFLVENVRTARRFISSLQLGVDISLLDFKILDKQTNSSEVNTLLSPMNDGHDVGVISEAGLPGIADPGGLAVAAAHRAGHHVVPLPGPNSILLALISSGFNGQQFSFHGYLPIEKNERRHRILQLEKELAKTSYTQVFMETPYRNRNLMSDLLNTLHDNTCLCVAAGISSREEFIKTMSIADWRKSDPPIHKIPTIFSIGFNC